MLSQAVSLGMSDADEPLKVILTPPPVHSACAD